MSVYNARQLGNILTTKELNHVPKAVKEKLLDILEHGHVQLLTYEGLFEDLKERSEKYEVVQKNFRMSLDDFGARLDIAIHDALKIQEFVNLKQKEVFELRNERDCIAKERDDLLKKLKMKNNYVEDANDDAKIEEKQLEGANAIAIVENKKVISIVSKVEKQNSEIECAFEDFQRYVLGDKAVLSKFRQLIKRKFKSKKKLAKKILAALADSQRARLEMRARGSYICDELEQEMEKELKRNKVQEYEVDNEVKPKQESEMANKTKQDEKQGMERQNKSRQRPQKKLEDESKRQKKQEQEVELEVDLELECHIIEELKTDLASIRDLFEKFHEQLMKKTLLEVQIPTAADVSLRVIHKSITLNELYSLYIKTYLDLDLQKLLNERLYVKLQTTLSTLEEHIPIERLQGIHYERLCNLNTLLTNQCNQLFSEKVNKLDILPETLDKMNSMEREQCKLKQSEDDVNNQTCLMFKEDALNELVLNEETIGEINTHLDTTYFGNNIKQITFGNVQKSMVDTTPKQVVIKATIKK